ncbi:RING/U-box superfamily protein [Salvia divinorum]|uniref:RING/U-box superfamily protein n=1 Tax=Salvia divinorum TaxID=28513 RepID=A0ABD1FZN3_SALDI
MICMYADSHLCTLTFILCTCIWIPLHRTTQLLVKILAFLVNPHHQLPDETPSCSLDLPVSRFRDLGNVEEEEEEMCSICLVEFEEKDLVNKLGRCGHTFHVECMEKWLETCQFTCPLCRSRLLHHPTSILPHCYS